MTIHEKRRFCQQLLAADGGAVRRRRVSDRDRSEVRLVK
jgi:hypothetical protein